MESAGVVGTQAGDHGNRPVDSQEIGLIAWELLAAAIATRQSEALLLRVQAALLAWFASGNRSMQCGFASVYPLALEVFGLRHRTVRERTALHRAFLKYPALEQAFLEGRISACQARVISPMLAENGSSPDRVDAALSSMSKLTVRELKCLSRESRMAASGSSAERADAPWTEPEVGSSDEGLHRVSFRAPLGYQIVHDQMMELARKVLGWDAPIHACMEAILQEAGWPGLGQEDGSLTARRADLPISVRPRIDVTCDHEAIAEARNTLRRTCAYLFEVRQMSSFGEPESPRAALAVLRRIHLLRSPQRVLLARILRDIRRTRAMESLGYRSMAELVEDRLHLSERSARDRVAESLLFECDEEIERAYAEGEISTMQARLIRRLARSVPVRPFVQRARQITWRQFQREFRLLELLRRCDLGQLACRPLPQSRIEEVLIAAIGRDREGIEEELRAKGVSPLPADGSTDPAENPLLMDRLEALVEMIALSDWRRCGEGAEDDRQMSAAKHRSYRVQFWAPRQVANDIRNVLRCYRDARGSKVPRWVAVVALFADVRSQWEQQDPESRPTQVKILRRDHYRCVIPGCTSRRRLETSHNRPRSLGGSDAPENLSVVCYEHHRRGIHEGYIRVSGKAPHALRFELGCSADQEPLLILLGNRILKGPFDAVPR